MRRDCEKYTEWFRQQIAGERGQGFRLTAPKNGIVGERGGFIVIFIVSLRFGVRVVAGCLELAS